MMKLPSILIPLMLMITLSANAQVSQIIHQAFTLDPTCSQLQLELDASNIVVKRTKGSRILIETDITISLDNERLLQYIISNGRYQLSRTELLSSGILKISAKEHRNVIIIRGEECIEEIQYTVYVPESINFVNSKTEGGELEPITMNE